MKNKIWVFLCSLFLVLILVGCSDDLTRSKAANQIKEKYSLPYAEGEEIFVSIEKGHESYLERFRNEGLINDEVGVYENRKVVSFTDKGKKYMLKDVYMGGTYGVTPVVKVKVAQVDFVEIKSIQEIKAFNMAEVLYTVRKSNITPFGLILGTKESEIERIAEFVKYDDGWRIEDSY